MIESDDSLVVGAPAKGRTVSRARFLYRVVETRPVFLWVAFALPAATIYAHSLAPGAAVFKGHDWGILVGVIGVVLTVLLWLPYSSDSRLGGSLSRAILLLIGAAWTWQVFQTQVDGGLYNLTAFGVPVILALVWLKRVPVTDYELAMMVLGSSMLLVSGLSLVLGAFGLTGNGFAVVDSGPCRLPIFCDFLASWPGATESLGEPARWGGPFGSVNLAAPMGGLVALIGFMAPIRAMKVLLVLGGLLVLTLGQARTAMTAFLLALLVMALWNRRLLDRPLAPILRLLTLGISVALCVVLILVGDPTLNGRTPIWSFYRDLWLGDWLDGVGDVGVASAVRENVGQVTFVLHDHAHSILLDGAVRYGLPALVLGLATYVLTMWAGAKVARTGSAVPLALAVYVFVVGLADSVYSWAYWSAYLATMVFVSMSVQARGSRVNRVQDCS